MYIRFFPVIIYAPYFPFLTLNKRLIGRLVIRGTGCLAEDLLTCLHAAKEISAALRVREAQEGPDFLTLIIIIIVVVVIIVVIIVIIIIIITWLLMHVRSFSK